MLIIGALEETEHTRHGCVWRCIGLIKIEPRSGFLGKKTYWTMRCCGKSMARCTAVQVMKCEHCTRTEEFANYFIAYCHTCGNHINMEPGPDL